MKTTREKIQDAFKTLKNGDINNFIKKIMDLSLTSNVYQQDIIMNEVNEQIMELESKKILVVINE